MFVHHRANEPELRRYRPASWPARAWVFESYWSLALPKQTEVEVVQARVSAFMSPENVGAVSRQVG